MSIPLSALQRGPQALSAPLSALQRGPQALSTQLSPLQRGPQASTTQLSPLQRGPQASSTQLSPLQRGAKGLSLLSSAQQRGSPFSLSLSPPLQWCGSGASARKSPAPQGSHRPCPPTHNTIYTVRLPKGRPRRSTALEAVLRRRGAGCCLRASWPCKSHKSPPIWQKQIRSAANRTALREDMRSSWRGKYLGTSAAQAILR